MLAKALGIQDADTIREIAIGGFVHDVGKLEIPEGVLTKPTGLTNDEWRIVRDHPKWGFEKLRNRDDMSFGQLMMVYQHHEKVNGAGYPVGCRRTEIHDWARLCTVVDVYEALTAIRPYRRRLHRTEMLQIMNRDSGKTFDQEMLKCWLTATKSG